MPIHDLGYRGWDGEKRGPWSRCLAIAAAGVKLAGRSRWLRRLLIVAWLPVLYFGIGFFFVGQSLEQPITNDLPEEAQAVMEDVERFVEDTTGKEIDTDQSRNKLNREAAAFRIERMFQSIPRVKLLADSIRNAESDTEARSRIWAWLLMTFFRYSQSVLILTIVGFVAPSLISQDLRSRALPVVFFPSNWEARIHLWENRCSSDLYFIGVNVSGVGVVLLCDHDVAIDRCDLDDMGYSASNNRFNNCADYPNGFIRLDVIVADPGKSIRQFCLVRYLDFGSRSMAGY